MSSTSPFEPAGRAFAALAAIARRLAGRLSAGHVLAAAVTLAALLYSWRQRVTVDSLTSRRRRRRRATTRTSGGSSGGVLAGVQRVTIGAEASGSALFEVGESGLVMRSDVAETLRTFATQFDVYVVIRVESDEVEKAVRAAIRQAKLHDDGGLDERKILFCETVDGRVSIARQIEPQLHIDEAEHVVRALQRFIKYVALVSEESSGAPAASNMLKYSSLAQFF